MPDTYFVAHRPYWRVVAKRQVLLHFLFSDTTSVEGRLQVPRTAPHSIGGAFH